MPQEPRAHSRAAVTGRLGPRTPLLIKYREWPSGARGGRHRACLAQRRGGIRRLPDPAPPHGLCVLPQREHPGGRRGPGVDGPCKPGTQDSGQPAAADSAPPCGPEAAPTGSRGRVGSVGPVSPWPRRRWAQGRMGPCAGLASPTRLPTFHGPSPLQPNALCADKPGPGHPENLSLHWLAQVRLRWIRNAREHPPKANSRLNRRAHPRGLRVPQGAAGVEPASGILLSFVSAALGRDWPQNRSSK